MSLRVLFVHNFYQQRGGEDAVLDSEMDLLRENGHEVALYARHNDELAAFHGLQAGIATLWSGRTSQELMSKLRSFEPDVIHAHNTFPLISPSLYWSAHKAGVPLVQTLHNFRLLCPQAMFLRNEQVCEDCLGKIPWRSITRACYRESSVQSAAVTAMLQAHRWLGTYQSKVTRYIALTEFSRAKFIDGGLPAGKISVKPNFVQPASPVDDHARAGLLFVGRLSTEKGVGVLAQAMAGSTVAQLTVIGTGPQAEQLTGLERVTCHGQQDAQTVRRAMLQASVLVVPSICYENFPRALVEAFACRLPVIASRLGAMAELVREGVTGLLFDPGSAVDLRKKMEWAIAHPGEMRRMGEAAHQEYERRYTPSANYCTSMQIYTTAITEAKAGVR